MSKIRAAVVGDPIRHSKSPQLHEAAYSSLGLKGSYTALRIPAGELPQQLRDGRFEGLSGLSVTMPHKQDAAAIADVLSERVRALGVANTLVFSEGRIFAENTDVDGIIEALVPARAASEQPWERMLIIGGGGTASAALRAASEMGLPKVTCALRAVHKAEEGEYSLSALAEAEGVKLRIIGLDEVADCLRRRSTDVVVSTLPPRAADPFARDWSRAAEESKGHVPVILDVAYEPWPSQLALHWPGEVVHGLTMLVHQAVKQVELFTGQHVGRKTVRTLLEAVGLTESNSPQPEKEEQN